ncbi:restriction endonuclease FokI C-terminal domain-containing protein, partial [Flavobacterium sp. UBA6046]|uniref:restriction endonuclease FokI C-terminal domain-containing protein n=1 Tax=Flavobacterium sp. UBA6046 TaxID=1946552 RepID=UPI0025B97BEF
FEMLGFEVKHLGQGTGRKPDGIALSKANPRYAILIDSKSRSEGYKFGTDDRAFVEYIRTYVNRLKNDGYDKLYFLVVSSKFTSIPESSVKRLALETHVPITFLTSRLLLKILANKIEKPRLFDLDKFRNLLIESGEISEK